MKHKILTTALASIMLAGGVGAVTASATQQPVQAISKHSWHWHSVRVVKNVDVYKLRFPLYKAPKYDFTMRKGSNCEIRYFGNNHYYEIRGYGVGKNRIVKGYSSSWFKNTK